MLILSEHFYQLHQSEVWSLEKKNLPDQLLADLFVSRVPLSVSFPVESQERGRHAKKKKKKTANENYSKSFNGKSRFFPIDYMFAYLQRKYK